MRTMCGIRKRCLEASTQKILPSAPVSRLTDTCQAASRRSQSLAAAPPPSSSSSILIAESFGMLQAVRLRRITDPDF